ncbi:MAG TPA: tetratricopeptide repeat protein [Alphaproteobacteria bacterium]|nr:tetratricopeptide repeat protein [Alphaproteobacteria bacterium]
MAIGKGIFCQGFRALPAVGVLMLAALLTAGCADSLDQTRDLHAPLSNMVRVAMQMQKQGDEEGAAEFYRRALQENPDDVMARKGLAEIFVAHKDYVSAAGQYHALVQLRPGISEFRCAYGGVLLRLNRPSEARTQYEAALGENPGDLKARDGLGVALDYMGRHRAAREQYKKVLDRKADDYAALSNLAHSYVLSGLYRDAIRILEPVYRKPAAPAALRANLAEAYVLAGMDVDAERVAAMDMPPDEVKRNIAFYRAERLKLLPPTEAFYADLGSFGTPALAKRRAARLHRRFAHAAGKLDFEVVPMVAKEGGTPTFFVRVRGFANASDAAAFCGTLMKQDVFCKVGS